jgi:hypothetical protein
MRMVRVVGFIFVASSMMALCLGGGVLVSDRALAAAAGEVGELTIIRLRDGGRETGHTIVPELRLSWIVEGRAEFYRVCFRVRNHQKMSTRTNCLVEKGELGSVAEL